MADNLLSELANLRKLFSETAPEDPKIISNYAWTIIKVILQHCSELGSTTARQLLADCIKLPLQRPSRVYSALLAAAVKVFKTYPDFHFATFLRLWDINNFLVEDNEPQPIHDGNSLPPLVGRAAKALGNSLLIHPEDASIPSASTTSPMVHSGCVASSQSSSSLSPSFAKLLTFKGYSIHQMLVTRIKQAEGKDGRKYTFVTLTSPEGLEIETVSHSLQPSPLHPLPEGKRHYANIGQLYNCLLRTKQDSSSTSSSTSTLTSAYLSPQRPSDVFPTEIGYIESIDQQHAHMHIYDSHSRHFVAPIQRFSRERVGDFVCFIPIIPAASKFKSAIILSIVPTSSPDVQSILREIRITHINKEKGYAAWELTDKTHPITETLSPLQLSLGETSSSFTSGYLHLTEELSSSSSSSSYKALIYLKRGKDHQKRPHVARLF